MGTGPILIHYCKSSTYIYCGGWGGIRGRGSKYYVYLAFSSVMLFKKALFRIATKTYKIFKKIIFKLNVLWKYLQTNIVHELKIVYFCYIGMCNFVYFSKFSEHLKMIVLKSYRLETKLFIKKTFIFTFTAVFRIKTRNENFVVFYLKTKNNLFHFPVKNERRYFFCFKTENDVGELFTSQRLI